MWIWKTFLKNVICDFCPARKKTMWCMKSLLLPLFCSHLCSAPLLPLVKIWIFGTYLWPVPHFDIILATTAAVGIREARWRSLTMLKNRAHFAAKICFHLVDNCCKSRVFGGPLRLAQHTARFYPIFLPFYSKHFTKYTISERCGLQRGWNFTVFIYLV